MVLSGWVLGPGFGFVLGGVSMFASALLTGGVGPWMPFQMPAMGWFAMGAGLLPGADRLRGRGELALLFVYDFFAAFAYGTLTNLAGWPFMGGNASNIAFAPDGSVPASLARFVVYQVHRQCSAVYGGGVADPVVGARSAAASGPVMG